MKRKTPKNKKNSQIKVTTTHELALDIPTINLPTGPYGQVRITREVLIENRVLKRIVKMLANSRVNTADLARTVLETVVAATMPPPVWPSAVSPGPETPQEHPDVQDDPANPETEN